MSKTTSNSVSPVQAATRCGWSQNAGELYANYHDTEWGVPVREDQKHFEFLILESAQAGLSWLTVLKKRDGYRHAFAEFDVHRVARFTQKRVEKLINNDQIIRNRAKIEAAVNNAQRFLEVQAEFGSFNAYAWQFVGGQPIVNRWKTLSEIPAKTVASDTMSKDMKRRGFKFFGSTICYAHMQAVGMINDHLTSCFRHAVCRQLAAEQFGGRERTTR
ncbi:MAG: DNA-3-methyladenine glycosylase I [Planctomycetales bacterium]|nr:DNA-3-methyladenine glycosylase I [Planctomycetales bacterium]